MAQALLMIRLCTKPTTMSSGPNQTSVWNACVDIATPTKAQATAITSHHLTRESTAEPYQTSASNTTSNEAGNVTCNQCSTILSPACTEPSTVRRIRP